jgi:hypothetical protein
VEIKDPSSITEVYVNLISEQWVGLDVHSSIKLQEPRQTIPLEAKNSIGKYLKKQGINNCSLSSPLATPQAQKRDKSSIVDQIKKLSEKRLGKILATPNILTNNKSVHIPAKRTKLLHLVQQKGTEDEQTDDESPLHNPAIHSRHVEPTLATDKETSSLPCNLMHTSTVVNQLKTLLKDESINTYHHPEVQLSQLRIVKCNTDQEQHNTLMLRDGGTCQSAARERTALLTAQTDSEHMVHNTQEANCKALLMKLPHNKLSNNDFKLNESSISNSTECSHTPFKENTEWCQASKLDGKHYEERMNKNGKSKPTITLHPSGEEHLETEKSVALNSLTNSSSSYNDSLIEDYNSEDSKTQDCDYQDGKASTFKELMIPPSTHSPDAHCSKKYLTIEPFQVHPPISNKDVPQQDNSVKMTSNRESEQLDFQEEHRTNSLAIINDNRSVYSTDSSITTEHTHTNATESAYLLNTKERRLLFQKTLPKYYYPVFMKSFQPDICGPTELHSTNCDHLMEPPDEVASVLHMREKVTSSGIESEFRKGPTKCDDGTWAAHLENVTKREEKIQPLACEVNVSNNVQTNNETSLPNSCKSRHRSDGSVISENRPQVHEDESTENENTHGDSAQKDYPVPNFDLFNDIDSFLAGMFNDNNTECNVTNIHNNNDKNSFMTNVPTIYLERNTFVSHDFPDNSSGYVHRTMRNELKYEPILNLLLKGVTGKEMLTSSSIMGVNEKCNRKVSSSSSSSSSSQFQFQPQSQKKYVNSEATNKRTLLHFTQEPKHIPPLSNSTQTSQTHNSDQSDYCNSQYMQHKFKCQPSVLGGYTDMSSDSDDTPESINAILQRNDISKRWNGDASVNIPMKQPSSFRDKKSYTQMFEFGNSVCTQPQMSHLQDRATAGATLYTPTKCTTGNSESSSNLTSRWKKFHMSPISSDDSPEVYY